MRFDARHLSFQRVDEAWVFALGDQEGSQTQPDAFVILSFGHEDEQDRALRLVGLHLETSDPALAGYERVRQLGYDGHDVVVSTHDSGEVRMRVATDVMTPAAIRDAVQRCNDANAKTSN